MKRKGKTHPKVIDESTEVIALGRMVGTVAGMVLMADPREVAEVKGAEKVKTSPSLGDASESGVAVVSVVSVLLLRNSATEEVATVTVGDIDVASVTLLFETNGSTGTPGDVVGDPAELPSVFVTPLVEELVGVRASSGGGVRVVVVEFKVAVVCVRSVVAAKRTPGAEIAELGASNTLVGPSTRPVPRASPPGNPEGLCTEEDFGMCDRPPPISLPMLVATGEVGREISMNELVTASRLAVLSDSTSSEGNGVRVSCGG